VILALTGLAFAGSEIAVVEGALRPGRPATIEVGSVTDAGLPTAEAPRLAVVGGTVGPPQPVRDGVWRWRLVPAIDADAVQLDLGDGTSRTVAVAPPPPSSLAAPAMVDVVVPTGDVSFVVGGDRPPPVDALEVVPAEGHLVSLTPTDHGLEVHLALDDRPFPRFVPVALLDRRRDEQPAWVMVRVRARPRIPIVAEAGAKLTLKVGARVYGPFVAGADGQIDARIDQYPADLSASAVLADELGNETHTEVPLIGQAGASLLAVSTGGLLPGRALPLVYVRGVSPDGGPSAAPTCRAPNGSLPTRSVGPGTWLVALPTSDDPADVRIACGLGSSTTEARVEVIASVPSRLGLRVWPEELQTDFPVAEVSVVLDDARGERIGVDGVRVTADHGVVKLEPGAGIVGRGEYDGAAAVEAGQDTVRATWAAPVGSGPVEEVRLGWGRVPLTDGALVVYARALDRTRRPLAGVEVAARAAGQALALTTGPDGWARGEVALAPKGWAQPVRIEASAGRAEAEAVVVPGDLGVGGPDAPDLVATQAVKLRPGRVAGISIEVDPSILRAGPGAVALVYVRLEDGAGQPVVDEPPQIEASEGSVGEMHVRPDGTWVAEYMPLPVEHARQVELTARTSTVRSSAHLDLEPRLVRVSLGPWIGARTNFGVLSGPAGGFDLDFRVRSRVIGEAVTFRLGGSVTAFRSDALTGVGPAVELHSTLVPLTGAVLLRQDRGPFALWGGAGVVMGPHFETVRFGEALVSKGDRILVGPTLLGGVGVRAPLGEIVFGLQGSWVPAGKPDVGYSGNLGGLVGGLGYRLVY
jgi:hypothetical protein